jgi:hypothetical protein
MPRWSRQRRKLETLGLWLSKMWNLWGGRQITAQNKEKGKGKKKQKKKHPDLHCRQKKTSRYPLQIERHDDGVGKKGIKRQVEIDGE